MICSTLEAPTPQNQTNNSSIDAFFDMVLMKLVGPYEPINSLEALLGDFGDWF